MNILLKKLAVTTALITGISLIAQAQNESQAINDGSMPAQAHTETPSTEIQTDDPAATKDNTELASIVLILDDLGNNLALGQRAIELPGAINYSFLPHTPNTIALAQTAHKQGKEIMLHVPMSNIKGINLGAGALTAAMEKAQFIAILRKDLNAIPHVSGVNNHMGSLLTQLQQPMAWFIKELKKQNLYFVDSRTSPLSVAETLAKTHKVPHLRRHVFLDNQRNALAISIQFEKLLKLAKKQGLAVAIAHPHPETLAFLESALPSLDLRGFRLTFASKASKASRL